MRLLRLMQFLWRHLINPHSLHQPISLLTGCVFMRKVIYLLMLLFASTPAFASCIFSGTLATATVNFPDIVIPRHAPDGTQLAAVQATFDVDGHYDYQNSCIGEGHIYYRMLYNNAQPSGFANVYKTNVPGIGISFINMNGSTYFFNAPPTVRNMNGGNWGAYNHEGRLVKIGPVESGKLIPAQIADMYGDDNITSEIVNLGSATNIIGLACEVNTPTTMAFNIGDVPVSEFTAIGTLSREVSTQNLGLDCDSGVNITIKLSGTQNPDTMDTSVLALNSSNGKSAAGIGVQLLYNGTPIKMGESLKLKDTSGGIETFAFNARYIQTKNVVTAGPANATATMDITYQ